MITDDQLVTAARESLKKWLKVRDGEGDPNDRCGFCTLYAGDCKICVVKKLCFKNQCFWISTEYDEADDLTKTKEGRALIHENIAWCLNFIDDLEPPR